MEGEIAKATAALVTALEHGSAHSAAELYADDATLLAPGGEPIRGRTSIEEYWATGICLGLSALAFERHVLKALGGQAVDAGRYTISIVSDAAGPVAEHGTYLVLYRQVAEGSWRRDIEIFRADEPPACVATSQRGRGNHENATN
jgi:ketosteroid isomerase-like protein